MSKENNKGWSCIEVVVCCAVVRPVDRTATIVLGRAVVRVRRVTLRALDESPEAFDAFSRFVEGPEVKKIYAWEKEFDESLYVITPVRACSCVKPDIDPFVESVVCEFSVDKGGHWRIK